MDKYRGLSTIPVLESKIEHLLGRLQDNVNIGSFQTQQELTRAYADIANKISAGAESRLYSLPKALGGSPVNESNMNFFLLGVYSELSYLLDTVRRTASMVEGNFNFGVASIRRLQASVKYIKQQLSVYSLYATNFGTKSYFGETFSNEDNIDRGSSFLSKEECFIDLAEGTISLPRLEDEDSWTIETVEIGANSNGVLGNNVEAGVPVRGALASVYDNNVDTWTEYEIVTDSEDPGGLKLELKISLNDIHPTNGIKIHPVFLGARSPFVLRSIDVSSDGLRWTSLKNDVRVAEFLDEDPEQRYHLSPHSSKFSGEFNITFAPRFVKFIKLQLRQGSAFPITDVNGFRRLRYAVGIKEISVFGHKYMSSGELIMKPIEFQDEFSVAGVRALVDPPFVPEEIGKVDYFMSFDDGTSWKQLTSFDQANVDVPEVLTPPEGIKSLRLKLNLTKDELAFSENTDDLPKRSTTEVITWPSRRPFDIPLQFKPVSGTLTVCDPDVGVRGKIYPKMVIGHGVYNDLVVNSGGTGNERRGNDQFKIKIPLRDITDPSSLYIYVNSAPWAGVSSVSDFPTEFTKRYVLQRSSDEALSSNDNVFEAVFGNGDSVNPKGAIPGPSDEISVVLPEQRGIVRGLAEPYLISLDFPSDGNKANTQIRAARDWATGVISEVISGGLTYYELEHKDLWIDSTYRGFVVIKDADGTLIGRASTSGESVAGTAFIVYKDFVDGISELEDPGDWTIDSRNGILYTSSTISTTYEITVQYYYEDVYYLADSDWDFVDGKIDEIQVYESGYVTADYERAITSGSKSATLLKQGVVQKSVRLPDGMLGSYSPFEVPFINGIKEFEDRGKLQDETVPTATSDATSIASFQITHNRDLISSSGIAFNETDSVGNATFVTEKVDLLSVTSTGDFFFDSAGTEGLGTGYVYVKLAGSGLSIPDGITCSYHYRDAYSSERMKGAYSVDIKNGIIHFGTRTSAAGTVTFKYTNYRIRHNISYQLNEGRDYSIDYDNKKVTILASAIGEAENKLNFNYQYIPQELKTEDLAPYYSPLLRALAVEVA